MSSGVKRGRPLSPEAAAVRAAILSAPDTDPSAKVADELRAAGVADITAAYVRKVRIEAGQDRGAGGGQVSDRITYKGRVSARAEALLDRLLADAAAAGIEPEVYIGRARGAVIGLRGAVIPSC